MTLKAIISSSRTPEADIIVENVRRVACGFSGERQLNLALEYSIFRGNIFEASVYRHRGAKKRFPVFFDLGIDNIRNTRMDGNGSIFSRFSLHAANENLNPVYFTDAGWSQAEKFGYTESGINHHQNPVGIWNCSHSLADFLQLPNR